MGAGGALAITVIETSFGTLLVVTVGLAALAAAGFLTTMLAAIALATVRMTTEIKHRTAGREVANTLAKNGGTRNRHRYGEGTGQPTPIMAG